MLDYDSQALKNVPLRVKQHIYPVNMFDNDYLTRCITKITSIANTLKNIPLGGTILNEFTSTYYNDNNDSFEMLFQKYTASAVNIIYHPEIIKEWKYNIDSADYEHTLHKGVVKPSLNI